MDNKVKAIHTFSCTGNLFVYSERYLNLSSATSALSGRSSIHSFSPSSGARMRKYLRSCKADYKVMCTLTYPSGHGFDGVQCKEQLRRFIQELRRYSIRNDCADGWGAFWFMEFQSRGSIHFHLFLTHRYPKQWIANAWYLICATDDLRHKQAGTRIETIKTGRGGIISYASKYAAKAEQKAVPEDFGWTGRFWGIYGLRAVVSAATVLRAEDMECSACKRRRDKVKKYIAEAIATDKAVEIETKRKGVYIVVIKSVRLLACIRQAIRELAICSTWYDDRGFNYDNYDDVAGIDGDD